MMTVLILVGTKATKVGGQTGKDKRWHMGGWATKVPSLNLGLTLESLLLPVFLPLQVSTFAAKPWPAIGAKGCLTACQSRQHVCSAIIHVLCTTYINSMKWKCDLNYIPADIAICQVFSLFFQVSMGPAVDAAWPTRQLRTLGKVAFCRAPIFNILVFFIGTVRCS